MKSPTWKYMSSALQSQRWQWICVAAETQRGSIISLLLFNHLWINRPAGQDSLQRPIAAQVCYDFKALSAETTIFQIWVCENPAQNGWESVMERSGWGDMCVTSSLHDPHPPNAPHTSQHPYHCLARYFAEISSNTFQPKYRALWPCKKKKKKGKTIYHSVNGIVWPSPGLVYNHDSERNIAQIEISRL